MKKQEANENFLNMQNEATGKYHYVLASRAKIKKTNTTGKMGSSQHSHIPLLQG